MSLIPKLNELSMMVSIFSRKHLLQSLALPRASESQLMQDLVLVDNISSINQMKVFKKKPKSKGGLFYLFIVIRINRPIR